MQVINYKDMFQILINEGKNMDVHGVYWYLKKKMKSSVINEYISYLIISNLGYSTPATMVIRNKADYYCASKFIDRNPDIEIEFNQIAKEYYVIRSLIACIFGGGEPCEIIFDSQNNPYVIDYELNFYHPPLIANVCDVDNIAEEIGVNVSIIAAFLNKFIGMYEEIIVLLVAQKERGYIKEINRILLKLRLSKKVAKEYLLRNG